MKLKLQGKYLAPIDQLLFDLKLKNRKDSRSRTKLKKLIVRKLKEFEEDRKTLIEAYAEKDEEGNPKVNEQGSYLFPSGLPKKLKEELDELGDELVIIEGGEYVNHITGMKKVLENEEIDIELSGSEADAYDHLLDAYEEAEKGVKNNGN